MINVAVEIRDSAARQIAGIAGVAKVRKGWSDGMRAALVVIERHHKREEMIRGSKAFRAAGGRLSSGDKAGTHPDKITVRTGTLARSYTRVIVDREMWASYGSDLVYAPVHEFGSRTKNIPARPGVQRTVTAVNDQIVKILGDNIEAELQRGGFA